MRKNLIISVFVAQHNLKQYIHFNAHSLLSGRDHNLNFPLKNPNNIFQEVEDILRINLVAENVAKMTKLNGENGVYWDFRVEYNEWIESK
ncbi:hypothetical protein [Rouxiella silvae]|uniref:hypothetical protein n=1 Tax=Rouxiella silvae TaxID=1646373 RepID=UPI0039EFE857